MANPKQLKVLLMGAGFGTNNMGVSALASGALRCLRAQGRDPEISLLDYGTETSVRTIDSDGRELDIPIVSMRFSKKFYLSNNIVVLLLLAAILRLLPSRTLLNMVLAHNAILRRIFETDIALALSGGDSFSDIYGLGRFFYVCLPQLLVLLLKKDLILLPQTLGPFTGGFSRIVARLIIGEAERVYSRDYAGLDQMQQLLGKSFDGNRHRFCYDLGFVVEPRRPDKVDISSLDGLFSQAQNLVGLNVSGLLWFSTHNNFGFRSDYRELMRSVIDHIISKKRASVLLVPHVFGDEPGSESDLLVCEQIYEELGQKYPGRLGVMRSKLDQCEVKSVIGTCEFFVGSRMHACIAALSQYVPAVAVAYSDKFIGVLDTIGVASLVADARKQSNEQILAVIDAAYADRYMINAHLAERIPQIKTIVLALCDELPNMQAGTIHAGEPALSSR
jgi:colanic acid/amylovoran biosynthesis protein